MNKTTEHKYGLERKLHKVDATDQSVGRVATKVATLLMGKHKADYSPQTDCGDMVQVENMNKLKWTGNKLDSRVYQHHSGYPGGLKTKRIAEVYEKDPAEILRKTIYNMLPKNRLRAKMLKRIKFV